MKNDKSLEKKENIVFVQEVSVSKLNNSDIYDVWLLDEDGERIKQVCGHPKKGTPRVLFKSGLKKDLICQKAPGHGTPHLGQGFCDSHEKGSLEKSSKNFMEVARVYSENNSLSEILEDVEKIEIKATNVENEIKMLLAMQLQLVEWIDLNTENGEEWNPARISWMVNILKEIIKSKEAAARIEGSMKLEMNTVKQLVELIMSFLVKELSGLLPKDKVTEIFHKMNDEVFLPATNQAMMTDKLNVLKRK